MADAAFDDTLKMLQSEVAANAAPKPKKSAAKPKVEAQYEAFATAADYEAQKNGKKIRSLDQIASVMVSTADKTDVVHIELIALKPYGSLFMLRSLAAPNKSILNKLKKVAKKDTVNVDVEAKNEDEFRIVAKLAAKSKKEAGSLSAKKDIVKKAPKKKKEQSARDHIAENLKQLKKKTKASAASVPMQTQATVEY